jgi:hypothetical protein
VVVVVVVVVVATASAMVVVGEWRRPSCLGKGPFEAVAAV